MYLVATDLNDPCEETLQCTEALGLNAICSSEKKCICKAGNHFVTPKECIPNKGKKFFLLWRADEQDSRAKPEIRCGCILSAWVKNFGFLKAKNVGHMYGHKCSSLQLKWGQGKKPHKWWKARIPRLGFYQSKQTITRSREHQTGIIFLPVWTYFRVH